MMIMMTFDVKLISQNCTPEAIAKKEISVSTDPNSGNAQYLHKRARYARLL